MKFMLGDGLLEPAEFMPVVEDHLLAAHPMLRTVSLEIKVLEICVLDEVAQEAGRQSVLRRSRRSPQGGGHAAERSAVQTHTSCRSSKPEAATRMQQSEIRDLEAPDSRIASGLQGRYFTSWLS